MASTIDILNLNCFIGSAACDDTIIPIKASISKSYSEDENLLQISHEAGILEDPAMRCPEGIYSLTRSPQEAPDKETRIKIKFKNGLPTKV